MEERRHNIPVTLVFFMAIKHVITNIWLLQQLVINEECVALVMMFSFIMERGSLKSKMIRSYEKQGDLWNNTLCCAFQI
jgi:hypothetical protein